MSKAYDDRGAAERAMLYGRTESSRKEEPSSSSSSQQTQIVKLLEQIRNRLSDIDKERSELWEAISDQSKTLNEIEDRSTSTEKTYLSLENRLSKSELKEAPLVERMDEIERLAKNKETHTGDTEDLRKEIIDRIEESDLQTARLIERIDEAMAMQTRMTRRIDKVVQDKQRLNRKISLLEESIDATRQALTSKALVLLSDRATVQANVPNIPLFHDTKSNDDIFSADDELKAGIKQSVPFTPEPETKKSSFAKQAIAASLFVIVAATAGWVISKNINSTPQNLEIPRFEESVVQENISPVSEPNYANSFQTADIEPYEGTKIAAYTPERDTLSSRMYHSYDEAEIAEALNNIEPAANEPAEPEKPEHLSDLGIAESATQPNTTPAPTIAQPAANISSPSIYESDENLPESLKKVEIDAFKGNAEAQHDLAVVYTAGRAGVPQNFERAAYWFEKASAQGIANARYNLGVLYHQGLGVEQDLEKAINWYEQAAQLGHGEAQYNLGIAYIEGIGVDYNPQRAAEYFESAAASGVPEAAFNLGLIYENGLIGTAQPDEAILWYKTASDLGNPDARNAMEQLAKSMNINLKSIDGYIEKLRTPKAATTGKQSQLTQKNTTTTIIDPVSQNASQVVAQIQKQLISFGLYPGPADGTTGPLTEDAIRLYQARHDIPVTGQASEDLLVHMMTKNLRNSSFVELGSGE